VGAPTESTSEAISQESKVISISHIGGGSVEVSEQSQRMQLLRANFPEIDFENRWVSFSGYLEKVSLAIASNDLADLQFCNAYNDVPLRGGLPPRFDFDSPRAKRQCLSSGNGRQCLHLLAWP
jgi:hypothetical protein